MLAAFDDVISHEVKINFRTIDGRLTFKEGAKDSRIKVLYINKIPEQSFAFTLDHHSKNHARCFKQLSCYVNAANNKGINKGCDLVVVTCKAGQWYVLVLDLKSDRPNISETKTQLLNSELYVRYIVSMLEQFYDENISARNICFKRAMVSTRVRKQSAYRPNDSKFGDDGFREISVMPTNQHEASVYLDELLALPRN